jgi:hypothetical protein
MSAGRAFIQANLLLLAAGGCSDVELNLGSRVRQRPVLPPPEPIRTGVAASAPADSPAQADIVVEPAYYQLVVISDPAPACETCGVRFVRVRCAPAKWVVEALARLYLPSGRSGSGDRYTLVYPTAGEWSAAAAHVEQLDVTPARPQPGSTLPGGFSCAVAGWYGLSQEPADRQQVSTVIAAFEGKEAGASNWERWAARMLLADLLADRLSDFDRAAQICADALIVAQAGSLEYLETLYTQARLLVHAGRPTQARRTLETIIGQFRALRGAEAHDRARQLLADLDRKR